MNFTAPSKPTRRAAWVVGEDPHRFYDQDGVELQALRLRSRHSHHRARHTWWPDHDAGPNACGFVADEFLEGSGQFVLGDSPGPWRDDARRTDSGGWTPGANSASSAAATVMISAGVR